MIRRKLSVGIIRRRSSVDRDPAFIYGIPLPHGYDCSAGADRIYGAKRSNGGNSEIRSGVGRRFLYADDRDRDTLPGFQRGRFDVQPVMEAGAPLIFVSKTGMGIEETAEKNEQQNKDTRSFDRNVFHRKNLFYYVMPGKGRGAK